MSDIKWIKSRCCNHIQEYDEKDPDTQLCEKCLIGNVFDEIKEKAIKEPDEFDYCPQKDKEE
ncbi:hypothetical protein KKE60_04535 [Patescibacteria group bacterium]|nr:hypothetical protein [Patescibacteria group bacterium]